GAAVEEQPGCRLCARGPARKAARLPRAPDGWKPLLFPGKTGKNKKFSRTPFPNASRRCTMRAPPRSGRHRRQPRGGGRTKKTASQGVDVLQNRANMCGSLDGNGLRATTEREAEINPSQGVDGSESRATMCGSPGRNG